MAYTPQLGDSIDFDFTEEYMAPSGDAVDFEFNPVVFSPDLTGAVIYYHLILAGGDTLDDIEIPFTSIQSRIRSGESTYLSVSIPSLEYADEINARADNKMQVTMGYGSGLDYPGDITIIETDIDQINTYEGATNKSIVLIGYQTDTYVAKEVELYKPTYKSLVNGTKTYRFAIPEVSLYPGDTAIIGSDSLVVDTISVYIKNTKSGPINTTEIAGV